MPSFDRFAAAALVLSGCATPLPGGDLSLAKDAGAPSPLAAGCLPFRAIPEISALTGGLRSVRRDDGAIAIIADDAVVSGAPVGALSLQVPANATVDDCLSGAALTGGAPQSAVDPPTLTPLAAVTTTAASLLYYLDPSGATGIAAQDDTDGRYRPTGSLLWASGRPSYGIAAAAVDDQVATIGCLPARFLDADCYLAQAPALTPGDESAYSYYTGSGRFSPRVDDAWAMTTGASSYDLAFDPASGRWILVYTTPFGRTITVRSATSPHGPWSAPIALATCDLADTDMFCGAIHLHPAIPHGDGVTILSYAAASFSPDVPTRRANEPDKWWPRLVALELPVLP